MDIIFPYTVKNLITKLSNLPHDDWDFEVVLQTNTLDKYYLEDLSVKGDKIIIKGRLLI